jgi:flagellar biogenesis protein FliO
MNITQRTITLLAVLLIFLAIAYPPWINRVISPHGHVVRENYIGLHSVWHDFSQEASYPRLDVSRLLLEISAILLFGLAYYWLQRVFRQTEAAG